MVDDFPTQLTLGVQLRDEANFDNFLVTEENRALINSLHNLSAADYLIYLRGTAASGRSHLIQALCHRQALAGLSVLYLPLLEKNSFDPDMLQGSNSLSMVCLDDIDAVCGDERWEAAIFRLYNMLQETDTHLIVTAGCAPRQLAIKLDDLRSRLQSGLVFQLAAMTDAEKSSMLQLRADNRGMQLNQQMAEYIVQRAERSLDALMNVLDRLDSETLQRGRRLTIPLIKEVMGW